jgi:hypothetical protein
LCQTVVGVLEWLGNEMMTDLRPLLPCIFLFNPNVDYELMVMYAQDERLNGAYKAS